MIHASCAPPLRPALLGARDRPPALEAGPADFALRLRGRGAGAENEVQSLRRCRYDVAAVASTRAKKGEGADGLTPVTG